MGDGGGSLEELYGNSFAAKLESPKIQFVWGRCLSGFHKQLTSYSIQFFGVAECLKSTHTTVNEIGLTNFTLNICKFKNRLHAQTNLS